MQTVKGSVTAGGAPVTTAVLGAGHAAASGTYFILVFTKAKKKSSWELYCKQYMKCLL